VFRFQSCWASAAENSATRRAGISGDVSRHSISYRRAFAVEFGNGINRSGKQFVNAPGHLGIPGIEHAEPGMDGLDALRLVVAEPHGAEGIGHWAARCRNCLARATISSASRVDTAAAMRPPDTCAPTMGAFAPVPGAFACCDKRVFVVCCPRFRMATIQPARWHTLPTPRGIRQVPYSIHFPCHRVKKILRRLKFRYKVLRPPRACLVGEQDWRTKPAALPSPLPPTPVTGAGGRGGKTGSTMFSGSISFTHEASSWGRYKGTSLISEFQCGEEERVSEHMPLGLSLPFVSQRRQQAAPTQCGRRTTPPSYAPLLDVSYSAIFARMAVSAPS